MDVIYGNVGEDLQLGEQKRTVDKAKDLIFRSVAGSNCGDSDGGGRGRGLSGGNRSGPFMVCGKMDDDLMMAPCVSEGEREAERRRRGCGSVAVDYSRHLVCYRSHDR